MSLIDWSHMIPCRKKCVNKFIRWLHRIPCRKRGEWIWLINCKGSLVNYFIKLWSNVGSLHIQYTIISWSFWFENDLFDRMLTCAWYVTDLIDIMLTVLFWCLVSSSQPRLSMLWRLVLRLGRWRDILLPNFPLAFISQKYSKNIFWRRNKN